MSSSPHLLPATPAVPVAPYIGGKRFLASRIVERIAAIPHQTYVEPFVGMGGVFLRRPFRAACEVINDISGDVVTLMRVLQRHHQALMDMLRWQLTSREQFERLTAMSPDTLTDLERAARFLYLQRVAFGGKVAGRNFGVVRGATARFDVTRLGPVLEAAHERLSGAVIERLAYADLIRRYDRPDTLFYLDPPYLGSETDYGAGVFGRGDFSLLAQQLRGIEGAFVLSINDSPEIRELFAGFSIEEAAVPYTISRSASARGRAAELLVSNT